MTDTYFDNELTITCLYNHMKNLYEMNRSLGKIVELKAEVERLEQKIIDINVKHAATLKEANINNKGKLAEDAALLKEHLKTNEALIEILREKGNFDRIRRQLENLIKKTPEERREVLCLIQGIVPSSIQSNSSSARIYDSELAKLLEPQPNAEKSSRYLEKVKKSLEKSFQDAGN